MKIEEFKTGRVFYMGERKWLCTDVGARTVAAICISEAVIVTNGKKRVLSELELKSEGWLNGPPYAVSEICLNEYDIEACTTRLIAPKIARRVRSRKPSVAAVA